MSLLSQALSRKNFNRAIRKVKSNGGGAGVDGMKVSALEDFFAEKFDKITAHIQAGTYQPHKVKGVEIEKPFGGKRLLGIPTAIDRTIQQAVHQVLSPLYEQEFSDFSYGFRPKRSARQCVHQALNYINSGYHDIIDLDLKKYMTVALPPLMW